MRQVRLPPFWTRYFIRRSSSVKTTWTFRIGLVVVFGVAVWVSADLWSAAIGRSLVCDTDPAPSDAMLLENFDPDYLVFERATRLRKSGLSGRVLVPITRAGSKTGLNAVSLGIAEVMAKISHLGTIEVIPIREEEPISLNAARDVLQFLEREKIRSVIVVAPLFRSRRSALVYGATLAANGITVTCDPVQGTRGVESWTHTWHGIQNVTEQWVKLQYYRFYVLPFRRDD